MAGRRVQAQTATENPQVRASADLRLLGLRCFFLSLQFVLDVIFSLAVIADYPRVLEASLRAVPGADFSQLSCRSDGPGESGSERAAAGRWAAAALQRPVFSFFACQEAARNISTPEVSGSFPTLRVHCVRLKRSTALLPGTGGQKTRSTRGPAKDPLTSGVAMNRRAQGA